MIQPSRLGLEQLKEILPLPWTAENARQKIKSLNKQLNRKVIVLDDDPTGTQTVHDLLVLTRWDIDLLRKAFQQADFIFYILTNTRSFEPGKAEEMNREILKNLTEVAKEQGCSFALINRGDSTLRGHYPLEIDVAVEEWNQAIKDPIDAHLIIPAFFEGQRYTYDDTHYIKEGNRLTPISQTEFSKDKAFGFEKSHLCEWVEEKTKGRIKKEQCTRISIETLRKGPDSVMNLLLAAKENQPIIVNALCYEDLDVLSLALLQAENQGKRFIYRTASSFIKSYAGIEDQAYLSKEQMIKTGQDDKGGLVIVGSHVQKTTNQLQRLLGSRQVTPLEISVQWLLLPEKRDAEIDRVQAEINVLIGSGKTVVVYTSRELIVAKNQDDNLKISQHVSQALTKVIQTLQVAPKFILAKGGITSSDVATIGLGIQMANVIGQAAAGIPVWLTGEEAKFPHMPYIVFPGNVGDDSTLVELVEQLA
ncbi:four-carbon acid sugar kinase family protein [Ammoniphilus sp. CFH 90114]|uniref:four-carbon acid sugar kinase family protein n=1 Tax=Ammoniphilus sp. CFH 90114 TaxID=2493665 RepID=UPI0013E98D9E|nr:four-carbon acid sugar kinase family protein [Ammoniphilus sp. CFH 90114]